VQYTRNVRFSCTVRESRAVFTHKNDAPVYITLKRARRPRGESVGPLRRRRPRSKTHPNKFSSVRSLTFLGYCILVGSTQSRIKIVSSELLIHLIRLLFDVVIVRPLLDFKGYCRRITNGTSGTSDFILVPVIGN
jgi:hypothetical protein